MTVIPSQSAIRFAQEQIRAGHYLIDARDAWSEHQPTTEEENAFIDEHGYSEYGRWHLGRDSEHAPDTKAHYKFPYGDFKVVHRCGVIAAEARAAQNHYDDIASAAAHLHGMLESLASVTRR
jgi:hypothetical protein